MWRACLARAVQRIVLRFRRNDACAESDWVEMSIRLPASAFQRTSVILPQSPPSYKPNLLGTGLKMAHLHIVQWDATNSDKTGRKELRFFL